MKKAQITAFILLGMVILGVFGSVIYITNYISDIQLQKKVDAIVSDIIQNTPINFYVNECLDNSLRDGLYLIGRQGGFIFPYQEGAFLDDGWYGESYLDNSFIFYNNFNITYLIQKLDPRFPNNNDVPYYPCEEHYSSEDSDNPCEFRYPPDQLYHYGSNPLFYGDANYYTLLKEEKVDPWVGASVQEQLEHFINLGIKFCTNFTAIGMRLGYNITEGNITTDVKFGIEDVGANLRFPLVITVAGHEPVTRMFDFFEKEDVRLGLLYKILRILIDPESGTNSEQTNLTFNITKEFESINRSLADIGGIFFKMDKNIVDFNPETHYNDIIILNDTFSRLGGDNFYIFQFARQNRIPSLDYICDDPNNPPQCPTESPPGSGIEYDFTVPFGHPIKIRPKAYDPDEDPLLFNYSGWLETRFEFWNDTKFVELMDTLDNCTWFPQNCVEVDEDIQPQIWTNSNPGWQLGFQVNYTTQERDIGAHNLTVSVSDYEAVPGFTDWQTLRILVVDHPIADADNSNNDYEDIPRTFASIEDVYWLDATASRGRFCKPWRYTWKDDSEEQNPLFPVLGEIGIPKVGMPYPPWFPESRFFDIRDMTGVFNNYIDPSTGNPPKLHKINLSIRQTGCGDQLQLVDTDTIEVNVTLCLPHRSSSAPYPYNNIPENPLFTAYSEITDDQFQGSHVCCSDVIGDWGNYNDDSTECYNFQAYTCKPDENKEYYPADRTVTDDGTIQAILSDIDTEIHDSNFEGPPTRDKALILGPGDIYLTDNDVYKRVFTQDCSGFRGNACSGTFTDNFVVATGCNDLLDPGQDERCEGPCSPGSGCFFDPGLEESCDFSDTSGCYDYAIGETFEFSYLQLEWADGICNNHWKLSENDTANGYNRADGVYMCQAACSGGGLCNFPVNCERIDDYDTKIPFYDTPGHLYGGDTRDYLPAVNKIWGYTEGDARTTPAVNIDDITIIPPPGDETVETWCDGKCFSNEEGDITSPTVPGPDTGLDTCTSRDYSPKRISEDSDVDDSIEFEYVDIDTDETWCETCSTSSFIDQGTVWLISGETSDFGEYGDNYGSIGDTGSAVGLTECCGDDTGENARTCDDNYAHVPPDCGGQTACCSESTDCVGTSGECIDDSTCAPFDDRQAYCDNGAWTDPDGASFKCVSANCGFAWLGGGEYDDLDGENDGNGECCGDDPAENWDTGNIGEGCCCNGNRIGQGIGDFCEEFGYQWCLEGDFCDDDTYDDNLPFGEPGLICGCDLTAAQSGYVCDSISDTDEDPDGICVTIDESDYFCGSDEICLDNSFYRDDCTSCSVLSECMFDVGVSGYTKEGLCVATAPADCCNQWASGDAGSPTVCTPDEDVACGAGTDGWHCDDLNYDSLIWQADAENYKCDESESACRKCDVTIPVEIPGPGPYDSTTLTCESGCGADELADEEGYDECSTDEFGVIDGYVDSTCSYYGEPDDIQQSCGCLVGTGKGDSNYWDDDRCCDSSDDDWLFNGNEEACDNGVLEICDGTNICEPITIEVGGVDKTYYCDGTNWVEEPIAGIGQGCPGNGICAIAPDGSFVCCGITGGEEIAYDSIENRFYCGCDTSYGGYGCEDVTIADGNAGGEFNQEGLCASPDGSSWECDTEEHVVQTPAYFATSCDILAEYGYSCDTTLTDDLPFESEGACTEDANDCCTQGLAVDTNENEEPNTCDDNCDVYEDNTIDNNYCDDVSDGSWDAIISGTIRKECDDTTGEGCVTCDYDTKKDDSGNCEAVCDAEPLCDELPEGYTGRCDLSGVDYFEDICSNCNSVIEDTSVCKDSGIGCNAPSDCDNVHAGWSDNTGSDEGISLSGCSNGVMTEICDGSCAIIPETDGGTCEEACGAISDCDEEGTYSLIFNVGWCYGSDGCTSFCTGTNSAAVDMNDDGDFDDPDDICDCNPASGTDTKTCRLHDGTTGTCNGYLCQ